MSLLVHTHMGLFSGILHLLGFGGKAQGKNDTFQIQDAIDQLRISKEQADALAAGAVIAGAGVGFYIVADIVEGVWTIV